MDALQQIGLVDKTEESRFRFVEGTSTGSIGCLGVAARGVIPDMLPPQPAWSGRLGDIYIGRLSRRSGEDSGTAVIECFTQNFVPPVRRGTVFRQGEIEGRRTHAAEASVMVTVAIESTENSARPDRHANGFREREVEWRRTHADQLRALQNQWVVLEREQIMAHGENPVEVIREARSKGVRTPYIFFVEPVTDELIFGL